MNRFSYCIKKILIIFVVGILFGISFHEVAEAEPNIDVRIIAEKNDRKNHEGSGFIWPDDNHVVTALHVVAGSDKILIKYHIEKKERVRKAKVVRILIDADLALLKLDNPLEVNNIPQIADSIYDGQVLSVLGYPLRILDPGPTEVHIRKCKDPNKCKSPQKLKNHNILKDPVVLTPILSDIIED